MAIQFNHETDTIEATGGELSLPDFSGGGLSYITEILRNGAEVQLIATVDGVSNVNVILTPGGQGTLQAHYTTPGNVVGGDARGVRAVDWQMYRDNSNQVASGSYSTIIGGQFNRSSGSSSISGGESCQATGANSVALGRSCTSGGSYSFATGLGSIASGLQSIALNGGTASGSYGAAVGSVATASGTRAFSVSSWGTASGQDSVCFSYYGLADGAGSMVLNGRGSASRGIAGARGSTLAPYGSYGSSFGKGRGQELIFAYHGTTSGATSVYLNTGGSNSWNDTNHWFELDARSAYYVTGELVAYEYSTNLTKVWKIELVMSRPGTGSGAILSDTTAVHYQDTGTESWAITNEAYNFAGTYYRLYVEGGAVGQNIQWYARFRSTENSQRS